MFTVLALNPLNHMIFRHSPETDDFMDKKMNSLLITPLSKDNN